MRAYHPSQSQSLVSVLSYKVVNDQEVFYCLVISRQFVLFAFPSPLLAITLAPRLLDYIEIQHTTRITYCLSSSYERQRTQHGSFKVKVHYVFDWVGMKDFPSAHYTSKLITFRQHNIVPDASLVSEITHVA